jgi:probable rRNA maturation factor
MISFQISEQISNIIDPMFLEGGSLLEAARITLEQGAEEQEGDFTILLTSDEQVQELNREYMKIDAPTDVLSFPADYTDPDTNTLYLGDVIISYPRAQEQAANGGHTLEHELQLLVVHGVLHLLGYDHLDEEEKYRMWTVQGGVLLQLGNPLSPP